MSPATAHNVAGFSFDGIIITAANMVSIADLNGILVLVATGAAACTAVLRLYILIRKGGKEK
jgi:hypothetical protein